MGEKRPHSSSTFGSYLKSNPASSTHAEFTALVNALYVLAKNKWLDGDDTLLVQGCCENVVSVMKNSNRINPEYQTFVDHISYLESKYKFGLLVRYAKAGDISLSKEKKNHVVEKVDKISKAYLEKA